MCEERGGGRGGGKEQSIHSVCFSCGSSPPLAAAAAASCQREVCLDRCSLCKEDENVDNKHNYKTS